LAYPAKPTDPPKRTRGALICQVRLRARRPKIQREATRLATSSGVSSGESLASIRATVMANQTNNSIDDFCF